MLTRIGRLAKGWVRSDPITNVYGAGRTFLALSTASTLAFTGSADLFHATTGSLFPAPECTRGLARFGYFCLFAPERLEAARWVAVALMLIVASGYRPRLTGIIHWWIPFSFMTSAPTLIKQAGDEVVAVLTLLLIPVTLLDGRRWHWIPTDTNAPARDTNETIRRLVAGSCLSIIRIQVAVIYFHSAITKFDVPEWVDGTALYYWFNQPVFPTPDWAASLISNSLFAKGIAWGTLALELALAAALFAPRRARPWLMYAGIAFHTAIGLTFGLLSFGLAMTAALILFLRPLDEQFPRTIRTPTALRHIVHSENKQASTR